MENLQSGYPDMEKQCSRIQLGEKGQRGRKGEREERAIYYCLDLSYVVSLPKAESGTQQNRLRRIWCQELPMVPYLRTTNWSQLG